MKREKTIESLVSQFAEKIGNLSDDVLEKVESGKFVISLTPAVGEEAGGAKAISPRGATPEMRVEIAAKAAPRGKLL